MSKQTQFDFLACIPHAILTQLLEWLGISDVLQPATRNGATSRNRSSGGIFGSGETPSRGASAMAMLFPMNIEEVNGADKKEDCEGEHCKDRPDAAAPWVRIPVHHSGPEFLDPLFFISVPIEW